MLLTQKEVLAKLIKNKIVTFTKQSFSEAVKIGVIPYETEGSKNRKMYNYEDVKRAIQKAGIGNPPESVPQKLNKAKPPKQGQNPVEYGSEVAQTLGANPTLPEANTFKAIYQGKLEQIKYEKELGKLVDRDLVETTAFTVARTIRDKAMAIPERLSDELASIDNPHVIKEMLYKEIMTMLDGFSEESFHVEV